MTKSDSSNILKATVVLALFALTVACSASFTRQSSADAPEAEVNIPVVEAVQARHGSLPLSERLTGTVISENQVVLYPEVSGRIVQVLVRNGDLVRKGDPLVVLEDRQYREQIEQARASLRVNQASVRQSEARLHELEAEYDRTKMLADEGLASRFEVETLEAQIASAQAAIDLAQAQVESAQSTIAEREDLLTRTVVRAPITGTVGQRNAEVGMQVDSGTQLFTIGNLNRVRVEVVLTDQVLDHVRVGHPARIHIGGEKSGASGESTAIEAKLSRISPFLDAGTRSTEAEIDVPNPDGRLRPGMFVAVDILHGASREATLVPTSALYTDPNSGVGGVYLVNVPSSSQEQLTQPQANSPPPLTPPVEAEFRPVDVVAEGRMELGVEGIEAGQWVVTVGQDLLSEGRGMARVRPSSWDRVLYLQNLQREDLLYKVLETAED
jgi:HlyD family secretion protein